MTRRSWSVRRCALGASCALTLLAVFCVRAHPLGAQGQAPPTSSTIRTSTSRTTCRRASTSRTSCASWARASAARRCSAFRCSSSGRTRTPATSRRPTTCRATRRSTTTRSPTPTSRACIASLPPAEQARLDPMITGFNPADMYAVDHIRRVLKTFPGVFTGIGEFSIHKEFVSAKIAGETASLTESGPRSHPRFRRRGRAGRDPAQRHRHAVCEDRRRSRCISTQMKALLRRHPKTTIIWAHIGLGRIVHPVQVSADAAERSPNQMQLVEAMLTDPALRHVCFDISWDEVAKYAVASPESIERVAAVLNRYPDRFLFGTDTVAPAGPGAVLRGVRPVGAGLAAASRRRRARRSARGTTSAFSTRDGGGSGPGSRPTAMSS